jgi:hypothetical protein
MLPSNKDEYRYLLLSPGPPCAPTLGKGGIKTGGKEVKKSSYRVVKEVQ